ncbi:MAG: helix-turn-helix domain-containing protein [Phycisphaeraceae bacterium]|nr:helix-turn-helix domain-containing protein [Phycisphaeraceae bacterium]
MTASAQTLRWKDFRPAGGRFHLARKTIAAAGSRLRHDHDFAELFWVNAGPGTHWINGRHLRLDGGDLIFIRPADVHDFGAYHGHPLTLTNVAFDRRELETLRRRYGRTVAIWPWCKGALPLRVRPDADTLSQMDQWAMSRAMRPHLLLDLHWLLLTVLRAAEHAPPPAANRTQPAPAWLNEALDRFWQPRHLANGVQGLADLAGRSPEHVSRTVRRHLGLTAVAWISQRRMAYAARELAMTQRPILEIAADCGLTDLSYFYHRFKSHFGQSPGSYRRRQQAVIRRGG